MQPPKLLIRKGMVMIQGRSRPCIQVLALVDPSVRAKLEENFLSENLFKRSANAMGFPAGFPQPSPSLAPHLGILMKSDACPEVTVKTILAGQLLQAGSLWEMKAFQFIACRAFDALVDLMETVLELGRETAYEPAEAQRLADAAARAVELSSVAAVSPAAVASAGEGVASAA